jgi:glycosyltransferase involved in cell wall biosynthesis
MTPSLEQPAVSTASVETAAKALLGICIPTYRRPEQLRRCVESIIRTAAPHRVPIFITDDSTDDTNVETIAALQAQYPLIVHHRNPKNLGIDGNILHSVDVCDARYAWIIGEDDRMVPEAVPTVLEVLTRSAPPFVYVNYTSVDEDLALVLNERSLPLEGDVEIDAAEFLARDAWSMGFIGACVVDRSLWSAVRSAPYVGTWFAHVGTILEAVRGRRLHLVARPLVLNRCGTARAFTWTGSTFDVLHGWERMVSLLDRFYPREAREGAIESFRRAHGIGSVRFFAYLRADRALTRTAHDRFVRNGPYSPAARRASWVISRTPPAVFQAARAVLFAIRRRRNRQLSGY